LNIELVRVEKEQRSVLRQLVELYAYDFSEYDQADVNDHGYFGYDYLDYYWTEPNRHSFFIRVDGKLAGFVLVSDYCSVLREAQGWSVSEFFVMRKYRRQGVGKQVAAMVFGMFSGKWEVFQHEANVPSYHFWASVVQAYTGGRFETVDGVVDECGDRGRAFIFDTSQMERQSGENGA
jgi:predicted acetyltransferase